MLLCSSEALNAVAEEVADTNLIGLLLFDDAYVDGCRKLVPKNVVEALAAAEVVELLVTGTPAERNLCARD